MIKSLIYSYEISLVELWGDRLVESYNSVPLTTAKSVGHWSRLCLVSVTSIRAISGNDEKNERQDWCALWLAISSV